MAENIITVEHLKKYYPVNNSFKKQEIKYLHAVDDVSFTIHRGEIFGVVGESGCGKSTLGRCLLRLTDITGGNLYFEDQDFTNLKQSELKKMRSHMQMVFQNPFSSFNPKMSIGQSLQEVCKVYRIPKKQSENKIKELLEYISLPADFLHRHPNELSGGQLQRLAIARALLLEPDFIVADEPVSALDVSVQAQILNLILDLREKMNLTMMFVSHELTVVEHICDVVTVMYLGVIVEKAPTAELFGNVMHPYTEALISAKPRENPEQETSRIILEGDVPSAIDVPDGCRFASRCPKCKKGKCDVENPILREITPEHFVACHYA